MCKKCTLSNDVHLNNDQLYSGNRSDANVHLKENLRGSAQDILRLTFSVRP